MKRVIQTLLIHLCCILLFAFLYYYSATHFNNNKQNKIKSYTSESTLESMVDFLLFSTTIQSTVGMTDISPFSVYGKILTIIQQFMMMSINVIALYIFSY
jgi:uncharacterized membrane protein